MKLTTLLTPFALALTIRAAEPTITLAECRIACEGGQEAMERFCRIVPHPALRSACWGLALALDTRAGQTACANWCYWQWGSRKREVLEVLKGKRDEVSLASDFALTGLEVDGAPGNGKIWVG
ncbi:hypothetical protein QBC38DRAFT_483461 [Podospora fimiseda]|uniref:Uncharacterized protein n=1 Tax=Podospora fimiseda TaxID=252190 RepID=A0AAN7BL37_9PEZI|nr:hypothetical protein QBC38DRAFT_483461 [Podospora fimiseda]